MGHLVDEAFLIKGVLRVVDRPPHPERHWRRADDIIDQVIRHVVGHFLSQAADEGPIDDVGAEARHQRRHKGRSGETDRPRYRQAIGAEAGDKARHAAGPIEIVRDVLFARPEELDGLLELLGDDDSLADIFLDRGAPAEAAAEHHLMHRDFVVWHAGRDRGRRQCGRRFLGRHPDRNAFRRDMSGAGLRLHSRMRQKRHRIFGVDLPHGAAERFRGIAVAASNLRGGRSEPGAHCLRNRSA